MPVAFWKMEKEGGAKSRFPFFGFPLDLDFDMANSTWTRFTSEFIYEKLPGTVVEALARDTTTRLRSKISQTIILEAAAPFFRFDSVAIPACLLSRHTFQRDKRGAQKNHNWHTRATRSPRRRRPGLGASHPSSNRSQGSRRADQAGNLSLSNFPRTKRYETYLPRQSANFRFHFSRSVAWTVDCHTAGIRAVGRTEATAAFGPTVM
jgi:hypothetical protein